MTNTNELRAAAERRRNLPGWEGMVFPYPTAVADAVLLADAYLAEVDIDCTDASRPSYWRGNDDGVRRACERITAILDGKDNGSGVCGEPLETLRRRLLAEHPVDDEDIQPTCNNCGSGLQCPVCDFVEGR